MFLLPTTVSCLAGDCVGQRQDDTQGLKKAHIGKSHLVFDGTEVAGLFWGRLLLDAAVCFASLALALNRGACLMKASAFTDLLKEKMFIAILHN